MKDTIKYTKGKNPNSRNGFKKRYTINSNFFKDKNILSSYYAGFIAADGYVSINNTLNLTVASKDESIINNFLINSESNYKINHYLAKNKFPTSYINIRSKDICKDLNDNFNIVTKKSLILKPPILKDRLLIDSYIVGYIDGDGSIGLYNGNKQEFLSISILGTFEVCNWIKSRFEEILGKKLINLTKRGKNTYNFQLTDKNARIIFSHYYNIINIPKLYRKWKLEYYEHCINYKKYVNYDRYKEVYSYKDKTVKEISKIMNISIASVYWYRNSKIYKDMEVEESING